MSDKDVQQSSEQTEGQDELSVRGLRAGGSKTVLREFKGKLDSITPGEFGKKDLNFLDVEAIKSTEPYEFPTATISIKYSNRKESGWGIFGESLLPFLAETGYGEDGEQPEDIKDTFGKEYHMLMEEGHVYSGKDAQTGKPFTGDVWRVVELEDHEKHEVVEEGTEEASEETAAKLSPAEAEARRLLDGKSLAEFNKAAYGSAIIRKDTAFQRTITDKSWVKAMVKDGVFTKDKSDIYHLVETPAE